MATRRPPVKEGSKFEEWYHLYKLDYIDYCIILSDPNVYLFVEWLPDPNCDYLQELEKGAAEYARNRKQQKLQLEKDLAERKKGAWMMKTSRNKTKPSWQ